MSPDRLVVICGAHDRPVILGQSVWLPFVRDDGQPVRREWPTGNAFKDTGHAVVWTCPKCGRSPGIKWRDWAELCAAIRGAGESRVDISRWRR